MPAEYKEKVKAVQCQVNVNEVPSGPVIVYLTIGYPIPKNWSKAKKDLARGKFCNRKPDIDNIAGAILDALFPESSGGDSRVVGLHASRYWSDEPVLDIGIFGVNEVEYYDDKTNPPNTR